MNYKSLLFLAIVAVAALVKVSEAGPLTVGVCYTACNAGYVTCMTASGLVAGTTGPVGWWAWITGAAGACSAIQGTCMAACTVAIVAPTP